MRIDDNKLRLPMGKAVPGRGSARVRRYATVIIWINR
jgi:hypothetical protein